jgi:twitching motility protein PilT
MTMTAAATDSVTDALTASLFGDKPTEPPPLETSALVLAMLKAGEGISDLVFSPGRPPQVEQRGELTPVETPEYAMLSAEDTSRVARDIVANNLHALRALKEEGACDVSYSVPSGARFRVNVFRQRGSYAIVMRVIPSRVPSLAELNLPAALSEVGTLKNGLVLVTGPTGSGKSSTLAAIINQINETRADHIITIEDPIEFLHRHRMATVHQRELHSDTPTFAMALRGALRQAPKVILVGEMRDRDTIEVALTAAETGHLVFSTLHTIDAAKTVDRIIGAFEPSDQHSVRARLAACFRYIISQRLLRGTDGNRMAVLEILKSTLRTRDYLESGETQGKSMLDAMRDSELDGMQHFDGEIEKLVRSGAIPYATGLLYATNASNLRVQLADVQPADNTEEDSLIIR